MLDSNCCELKEKKKIKDKKKKNKTIFFKFKLFILLLHTFFLQFFIVFNIWIKIRRDSILSLVDPDW